MKVVIIGSGNVATVLGGKIAAAGHTILQVVAGRQPDRHPGPGSDGRPGNGNGPVKESAPDGGSGPAGTGAARLAAEWGCPFAVNWAEITREADTYVVSISDGALRAFGEQVRLPGRLVLHTAGAVSGKVLLPVSSRCGVLYPLQSLRREIRPFPEFPLLIDAEDPSELPEIEVFARTLAKQVQRADDGERLRLHVAAVVINNFSNYLYTLSADFCRREGVDFGLLLPLIRETAGRLEDHAPRDVQTGPAIRGDAGTIKKHLELLSKYQELSELYRLFSIQIEAYYEVGKNRDADKRI